MLDFFRVRERMVDAQIVRRGVHDRYAKCEKAIVDQCRGLLQQRLDYAARDGDDFFDAAQNARLVASAERYYRMVYYGGADSWNLRGTHMWETLEQLLEARWPRSKAVVWGHNSRIGDARFTDMGVLQEELNVGQLCRQRFGEGAGLIGFGCHSGTVAAASDRDSDVEFKRIRASHRDSYERLCHDAGSSRFLLDLRSGCHDLLRHRLLEPRLERFIGVVYRLESERLGHYTQVSLPQQFDTYVWFNETTAVTALGPEHGRAGTPETYPFGL
jgi:erythromycin esterase-like protein